MRRHDLNRIIREAQSRGWSVTKRKRGHICLKHPGGGIVFSSLTPSCYRGLKNLELQLRRAER